MIIERTSDITGVSHSMDIPVSEEEFNRWLNDPKSPNIQFAFPELTDDQREFLLTGITNEEWDKLFGDE